jgi:hypothetical protein
MAMVAEGILHAEVPLSLRRLRFGLEDGVTGEVMREESVEDEEHDDKGHGKEAEAGVGSVEGAAGAHGARKVRGKGRRYVVVGIMNLLERIRSRCTVGICTIGGDWRKLRMLTSWLKVIVTEEDGRSSWSWRALAFFLDPEMGCRVAICPGKSGAEGWGEGGKSLEGCTALPAATSVYYIT